MATGNRFVALVFNSNFLGDYLSVVLTQPIIKLSCMLAICEEKLISRTLIAK